MNQTNTERDRGLEGRVCDRCGEVVLGRLTHVEIDTPDGYGWEGEICDECKAATDSWTAWLEEDRIRNGAAGYGGVR